MCSKTVNDQGWTGYRRMSLTSARNVCIAYALGALANNSLLPSSWVPGQAPAACWRGESECVNAPEMDGGSAACRAMDGGGLQSDADAVVEPAHV
jgi:hypothetical protein